MSKFTLPAAVTEESLRLGQRVRVARLRRGWSVADLAEKVGVNRNTITALERIAKPALGGKSQQADAQAALESIRQQFTPAAS